MTEPTSDLLFEVLKEIQANVAYIRRRMDDHDEQFKSIRHMLMAMQGDDLRHEATIAAMRVDIDRINKRLNLSDA
ncbi:MAG: hypothetical protein WBO35_05960 [Candidatus Saccharimonadales bacterium]